MFKSVHRSVHICTCNESRIQAISLRIVTCTSGLSRLQSLRVRLHLFYLEDFHSLAHML